jgi:hypothetical protein
MKQLPLHRWRVGILELQPIWRTPRSVTRSKPLRNYSFQPHLAGVLEHNGALRVLKVIVQPHAVLGLAQDAGQGCLADLDRLPPPKASKPRGSRIPRWNYSYVRELRDQEMLGGRPMQPKEAERAWRYAILTQATEPLGRSEGFCFSTAHKSHW